MSGSFDWSDEEYALAVASLQFFCLGAAQQESHWRQRPADMPLHGYFRHGAGQLTGSDYFFGIGSVFLTYRPALRERAVDARALELLADFGHRLDVMMCQASDEGADDWTPSAAAEDMQWQKLRANADAARLAFGLDLPTTLPAFDICGLVEAPPSEETRRLLNEL